MKNFIQKKILKHVFKFIHVPQGDCNLTSTTYNVYVYPDESGTYYGIRKQQEDGSFDAAELIHTSNVGNKILTWDDILSAKHLHIARFPKGASVKDGALTQFEDYDGVFQFVWNVYFGGKFLRKTRNAFFTWIYNKPNLEAATLQSVRKAILASVRSQDTGFGRPTFSAYSISAHIYPKYFKYPNEKVLQVYHHVDLYLRALAASGEIVENRSTATANGYFMHSVLIEYERHENEERKNRSSVRINLSILAVMILGFIVSCGNFLLNWWRL